MTLKAAQIYVVDDDAAAREAVAVLVRTLGLDACEFESAERFLQEYDGHRPACIVVDLRLLGMSGLELLKELRHRGLTIPVILLTAHADTPTTVQAMKNGAFTTLDKPCRDSELWDTIRAALKEDLKRCEDDRRRMEIRARFDSLSAAERDVLEGLVNGETNKEIAFKLNLSLRTVESRRQNVFHKMEADSLPELVKVVLIASPEMLHQQHNVGE